MVIWQTPIFCLHTTNAVVDMLPVGIGALTSLVVSETAPWKRNWPVFILGTVNRLVFCHLKRPKLLHKMHVGYLLTYFQIRRFTSIVLLVIWNPDSKDFEANWTVSVPVWNLLCLSVNRCAELLLIDQGKGGLCHLCIACWSKRRTCEICKVHVIHLAIRLTWSVKIGRKCAWY